MTPLRACILPPTPIAPCCCKALINRGSIIIGLTPAAAAAATWAAAAAAAVVACGDLTIDGRGGKDDENWWRAAA